MSAQDVDRAKCKGKTCQREIIWAEIEGGGKVPLDPVAAVYLLTRENRAVRAPGYYVNHFATCPDSNQFNKKGREGTQTDLLTMDAKTALLELADSIEKNEASLGEAVLLARPVGEGGATIYVNEETARKVWAATIRRIVQGGA